MVNILITGGAGYIGTALAERLVREGHNITLYDSLTYGRNSVQRLDAMLERAIPVSQALLLDIDSHQPSKNFRFVEGDTRDRQLLERVFSEGSFNIVFHLGELMGHYRCEKDPALTREVNFIGTKNVVDLAAQHIANLVYNSSSSVYGFRKNPRVLNENAKLPILANMDNYCLNKVLVEQYIIKVAGENPDFRYIILRPATVGGLSARIRLDLLPNHFAYAAIQGRLSLSGPGHYHAVIDINDLVEAYVALINLNFWPNSYFNIGHHNMTRNSIFLIMSPTPNLFCETNIIPE